MYLANERQAGNNNGLIAGTRLTEHICPADLQQEHFPMSIFDSIKKAIFGEAKAGTAAAADPAPLPGTVVPPSTTSTSPASTPAGTATGASTTAAGSASAAQAVDVAPNPAALAISGGGSRS
jgi:hypothetical protein